MEETNGIRDRGLRKLGKVVRRHIQLQYLYTEKTKWKKGFTDRSIRKKIAKVSWKNICIYLSVNEANEIS